MSLGGLEGMVVARNWRRSSNDVQESTTIELSDFRQGYGCGSVFKKGWISESRSEEA